ncbi:MAG: putative serine protease HhoB [Acidimicrobiales bacterium]|nr:putative serine protease HhoB [Acidimicrobiales bacterium]
MTALDEVAEATRGVAERVGASVVAVGRNLRGAGVIVGDGLVITCAHNLRGRTTHVTFTDGEQATASVAGADFDGDLAALVVETGNRPTVRWGNEAPRLGDVVFAVGVQPDGSPRVTAGSVSGTGQAFRGPRGRRISGSVEHTAPLPRGSSGSPVVDSTGCLVGVNTHRLGDGFYLAQPADTALKDRVDALATGEAPSRRWLGVAMAPGPVARKLRRSVGLPERDGLLVRHVEPGSPADGAGLREGDLVVGAGGNEITSIDDLHDALDALETGATLTLDLVRGTDELRVTVVFDEAAAEGSA